jgi:3-isopropylmalate/(R)-2-methylmalate dehydratase large subunit
MGGYRTAREIIEGHAVSAAERDGRVTLEPDVVALGGEEAIAALEREEAPREGAPDAGRVMLFAGDCRGGGSARLAVRARLQATTFGFQLVHPAAGCGPPVLTERGLAGPGTLTAALGLPGGEACGDGSLAWPVGPECLGDLLERGVFEAEVPGVHRVQCGGELGPGVNGVDVGLYVAAQFGAGGARGALLEFGGAVVEAVCTGGHSGIADAVNLCGPEMVLCAPGTRPSAYDAYYEYDFSNLVPQCAAGSDSRFGVAPLAEATGAHVHRVVVGPAASAADIREAARFMRGKRVHADVQVWVSPASRRVHFEALAREDLTALIDAGASVLPSCTLPWAEELTSGGGAVAVTGACAFDVCRERGVEVYYVNAYAAAAAALAGELCDPTPVCERL